jgi:4-amino-4-deoxy-L-arabinose transferase-like glycosyltransferase
VRSRPIHAILIVAALVLVTTAWLRSAEYDEQYTLFISAGQPRPEWPRDVFTAGDVQVLQAGHAGFSAIARDLRTTDVHPPLYFWAVAAWRQLAGEGLIAARLASVQFGLITLCAVVAIARLVGIPAASAVLLTLGCYGFTYTATIARGFALAQMLTVSGIALLLFAEQRKQTSLAVAAGVLLGAATFTNYLAAFIGLGALLWLLHIAKRNRCASFAIAGWVGFAIWLPADMWFALRQRHSRVDQFPAFDVVSGVARLVKYLAANVVGGLPLYFDGMPRTFVTAALAMMLVGLVALTIRQWRHMTTPATRALLAIAAIAPPIGLLLLGLAFNNTPIELRYLAYATPFIGLLLAGTFAALPRRVGVSLCPLVLTIQAMALVGLMTRPETMQPARDTAAAAAALVQDGVVLLPHGNDGVGIVGAFAVEAPSALRLLVVSPDETAAQINARADGFPRVVLALLDQDRDSHAALPAMRNAFANPCWRPAGTGFNVLAFERIRAEAYPCSSQAAR